MNRRNFLRYGLCATAGITLGNISKRIPGISYANDETILTILHTNDTHSQIEPLKAGPNVGKGGVARRASIVKQVRQENPNTLLVDAGDVCQGTPYFNFFRGEVEYKAMNMIGYDVGTIGNHEFDNGVEPLTKALGFANFPIVIANYDMSGAPSLKKITKPYVIKEIAGIRVGIFGLGVDFKNLVTEENHIGVKYLDPVKTSHQIVKKLREKEKVDFIVALSHLGYSKNVMLSQDDDSVDDITVAQSVQDINFIVGGHTHTFMKEPGIINHPSGKQTILFQVGYAGINVGRVDFIFKHKSVVAFSGSVLGDKIDSEDISVC